MLKYLEPRSVEAGTMLINELDELVEIIYFTKGIHKTGYMLNKKEMFVEAFKAEIKGSEIGAYGTTFHMRSRVIYKTATHCTG